MFDQFFYINDMLVYARHLNLVKNEYFKPTIVLKVPDLQNTILFYL